MPKPTWPASSGRDRLLRRGYVALEDERGEDERGRERHGQGPPHGGEAAIDIERPAEAVFGYCSDHTHEIE
jgi:hypothetical protein